MNEENKNSNEGNILKFEDLFAEELKIKKVVEEPEHNKSRYGFSILYYILIMFIVASIIQILFISDEDNIHYYTKDEVVLSDLINDTYGLALIETETYDEDLASQYDGYVNEVGVYGSYTMLYNINNNYIINDYTTDQSAYIVVGDDVVFDIISGSLAYWSTSDMEKVTIHISDDATILSDILAPSIDLVSYERLILDGIIEDTDGIALIDKNLYDNYYASYANEISVTDYNETYYVIYHRDNTEVSNMGYLALYQIFTGETLLFQNGDEINIYTYTDQLTTSTGELLDMPAYYLNSFGWDFTGFISGLINFLIYLLIFPVLIILLKPSLSYDFGELKVESKSKILATIVTGYVFLIFANLIAATFANGLSLLFDQPVEVSINQLTIEQTLNSNGAIFMVLSAVVLGPIVEELVFRKAIFGLIKKPYIALVVSSFVFGAIHLLSEASLVDALINGVSYIIMGFVFGLIYIRTKKNIFYPIAVHMISNLISIVAILFI